MKCIFTEFEAVDPRGRRRVRCERCGRVTAPTASPLHRIHFACRSSSAAGFGDTVARALHALGFQHRRGCGCSERQAALNRLLPFSAAKWRERFLATMRAVSDLPRWLLPSSHGRPRPPRILQVCRTLGTACGVANFAQNLHDAAECAGAGLETVSAPRCDLAAFDVALVQHENAFYLRRPAELREMLARAGAAGVRRVLFVHSPPPKDLDPLVDAYATMAPGMVETAKPVHLMPHPAHVLPIVDRAELRTALGLHRFQAIVGTHGFITPPRRYAEFVERLAPVCRELGGAVIIAASDHAKASEGGRQARQRLAAAVARHRDVAFLAGGFAPADRVNLLMQACDLTWCFTHVPSRPYASGVASDLYGAGSRLVVANKLQHRAAIGRENVVIAPEDFDAFVEVLIAELRRGTFPRHDPAALSWAAEIGPLLSFLEPAKAKA